MSSSHSVDFDSPPPEWTSSVETVPTASEKLWLKCKQTPFVPLGESDSEHQSIEIEINSSGFES